MKFRRGPEQKKGVKGWQGDDEGDHPSKGSPEVADSEVGRVGRACEEMLGCVVLRAVRVTEELVCQVQELTEVQPE